VVRHVKPCWPATERSLSSADRGVYSRIITGLLGWPYSGSGCRFSLVSLSAGLFVTRTATFRQDMPVHFNNSFSLAAVWTAASSSIQP